MNRFSDFTSGGLGPFLDALKACIPRGGSAVWVLATALLLQGCASPSVSLKPEHGAPISAVATPTPTPTPSTTPTSIPTPPQSVAVELPPSKPPLKLGLALGGGAARGFAHIGVIQVLEEAGIRPDLVCGTSAGSLVAALYASGKNGQELQQIALTMDEAVITDWTLPFVSRGVLKGEALGRYVEGLVSRRSIENFKMPLGIVTTDLKTGEGVLFQRGNTALAVRASSAVPGVFEPVRIGGRDYVDGGLVAPVPVAYARQMGATFVVAVDISSPPEDGESAGTLQIMLQTFAIMSKSLNRFELKQADVVVRPPLMGVASTNFAARRRAIESGRQAMLQALPALKAALAANHVGPQ